MYADQLIEVPFEKSAIHYANCAKKAGLDGVVSSAWEGRSGIKDTAEMICLLNSRIRPEGTVVGDQIRVVTPLKQEIGSTFHRCGTTQSQGNSRSL